MLLKDKLIGLRVAEPTHGVGSVLSFEREIVNGEPQWTTGIKYDKIPVPIYCDAAYALTLPVMEQ